MGEEHGDIRFVKNLLIYLLYIIIIPIIIYDMFLIIQTLVKPGQTPDFFGYKTFNIISGSMEPDISIDDIVIVKKVDRLDIRKYDIITFVIDDQTVTHRVIGINFYDGELIYTTKGDKNEVTDTEKILYSQIEGKYVGKIPKAGKLFAFLKNKYVFAAILIILILFYGLQRKHISKKVERREKREKYERKEKRKQYEREQYEREQKNAREEELQ